MSKSKKEARRKASKELIKIPMRNYFAHDSIYNPVNRFDSY